MREILLSNQYKKDLKKAKKNPRQDISKLEQAVTLLATEGVLPETYRPHLLIGNWSPKLECHIQPDFLLIYEVSDTDVILHRCGSHSYLF